MSQAHVGIVIETLLADEDLRIRFALERMGTIADLCVRGIELTSDEIDLFCQTDARLWFVGDEVRRESRRPSGPRRLKSSARRMHELTRRVADDGLEEMAVRMRRI